jgi:hypothetical protein
MEIGGIESSENYRGCRLLTIKRKWISFIHGHMGPNLPTKQGRNPTVL